MKTLEKGRAAEDSEAKKIVELTGVLLNKKGISIVTVLSTV